MFHLAKRLDADEAARERYDRRWDRRGCDVRASFDSDAYETLCLALSKRADGAPSPFQILGPVILMYAVLFALHPVVLRDSRRFQQVVQIVVIEADDLEAQARRGQNANVLDFLSAPRSLVGARDESVFVEALAAPTRLLKQTSTLYARAAPVSPARAKALEIVSYAAAPAAAVVPEDRPYDDDDDDLASLGSSRFGDDAEAPAPAPAPDRHLCYVCCLARRDAVIMECGHGGLCYACGVALAQRHPRTCPICRSPISSVLRVERRARGSSEVVSNEGVAVRERARPGRRPGAPPGS